jgi:type II secretory pathway component PulJ
MKRVQIIKKHRFQAKGMTIVEAFCSAVISALIIGAMFYALSTGEYSKTVSSARVEVQAEARRTLDWIAKDVRQTVSWDMADASNSPSDSHIKFRKVEGWNATTELLLLSNNYTEYAYDSDSHTIMRRLSDSDNNTLGEWTLNNIVQPPFYTRDSSESIVSLNSGDLLTSRKLIIDIVGQKQIRGSLNATATLTEEVKIRNE